MNPLYITSLAISIAITIGVFLYMNSKLVNCVNNKCPKQTCSSCPDCPDKMCTNESCKTNMCPTAATCPPCPIK